MCCSKCPAKAQRKAPAEMLFSLEEFQMLSESDLHPQISHPSPLRPSEHSSLSVFALTGSLRNVSPVTFFDPPLEIISSLSSLSE